MMGSRAARPGGRAASTAGFISQAVKAAAGFAGGQSLVVVAAAIAALVAMVGLAIDGGYAYAQRRLIQNLADSAALAGAGKLRDGLAYTTDAEVRRAIERYAGGNRPLLKDVYWEAYYTDALDQQVGAVQVGDLGYIPPQARGVRVVAYATFDTFFMRVLGINLGRVSASSVARIANPASGGTWALWVGGTGRCSQGALNIQASDVLITGALHSNANIQLNGGGQGIVINGTVESVLGVETGNPAKITYNPPAGNPALTTPQPMPFAWPVEMFAPGGAAALAAQAEGRYYHIRGDLDKNSPYIQGGRLQPGLYFVEGDVKLGQGGGRITGENVTIVARGQVDISGGSSLSYYRPAGNPCAMGAVVLASYFRAADYCSTSSAGIQLSGNDNSWVGVVYAPFALVKISNARASTLNGAVIAQGVSISGSQLNMYSNLYCAYRTVSGPYVVR